MKRRGFLALGAVLGVSACHGGTGGSAKSITYWSNWKQGEGQQKVIARAITDFTAETGIDVDVQWQGRTVPQKLVPALNTNKVPDIVDGSFAKLAPVLVETKQGADLSSAYQEKVDDSTVNDLISEQYRQELTARGEHPWMLPYLVSSDAIWFDRSTHPELAKNPPTTWDEFVKTLKAAKSSGKTPLAADGDIAGYNAFWFTTLYLRETGPGGFAKLAQDKSGALWESKEALSASQKVEQLVNGGYFIDGYTASKWPAQQQAWATGKAELLFNGSWIPTETGTYATKDFSYASFPFPYLKNDHTTAARADFTGFAIPQKSKKQKEAGRLAAFLLRKKYQDLIGTDAKSIPVRDDASTPTEQASVVKALRNAKEVYQQNDGVTFSGYLEKTFWPLDDELFLGKINAQQFVTKMKAAQVAYWKANG